MSDILESIKAAYEEGFDDGMQMHRSDFDERWSASNAKLIYDSMKAARESEGCPYCEHNKAAFERELEALRNARKSEGGEAVDSVIGDMVSIDVSTCDEDSGNRVFGKILEWQEPGPDGGRVWLCSLDQFNYSTPQPDKWIPCSERLPTNRDGDCDGYVWGWSEVYGVEYTRWYMLGGSDERWMPTGLTRPAPPEQESE